MRRHAIEVNSIEFPVRSVFAACGRGYPIESYTDRVLLLFEQKPRTVCADNASFDFVAISVEQRHLELRHSAIAAVQVLRHFHLDSELSDFGVSPSGNNTPSHDRCRIQVRIGVFQGACSNGGHITTQKR